MTDKNPLISGETNETLLNINAVLTFIQDCYTDAEDNQTLQQDLSHCGLSVILKCVCDALGHEIENLSKEQTPSQKARIFKA